jgi:hypothetical protein
MQVRLLWSSCFVMPVVTGKVDSGDWELNDQALMDGDRILSANRTVKGVRIVRIWIITEADRYATTILLRDEY